MNRVVLFVYLMLLFACKSEKPKETFLAPSKNNINEIVKEVIEKEHLYADVPLVSELRKINILIPTYATNIPRPIGSVQVNDLLNTKVNQKKFFEEKDSLYMLFQNGITKTFQIETTISTHIKLIHLAGELKNIKSGKMTRFYDMTIPVFSSDNKKAYVELDYNCSGLCGEGTALLLQKINEKWVIVKEENLWVS